MRFAIDDNLGIPNDFAERFGCELVSFHDLANMLARFSSGDVVAMFAPCGTLPYLTVPHEILGAATMGPDRQQLMESRFVVLTDSQLDESILTRGRIGCVNTYCTTSYWSPMIARLEQTSAGSPLHFREMAGFADMLCGVVDGRVDAAMVWTEVLTQHPLTAGKTRELFRETELPTPLVLCNSSIAAADKERLRRGLLDYRTTSPGFFSGFAVPDIARIQAFLKRDRAARKHYRLDVAT